MLWFNWKSKRVRELELQLFDIERRAVESEQFERIASARLEKWVKKHDDLLIAYKQLKSTYEPENNPQAAQDQPAPGTP